MFLAGQRIDRLGETRRSKLRRDEFGFVFQSGMLVSELTAQENAALPLLLGGTSRRKAMATAAEWLSRMGLEGKEKRLPGQLSGGEAQRVAIARALGHWPTSSSRRATGALDSRRCGDHAALLDAAAETDAAVVVVTHDRELAASMPLMVSMRDGRVQL